jgi:cell wall-associated NlpC family hydrolase
MIAKVLAAGAGVVAVTLVLGLCLIGGVSTSATTAASGEAVCPATLGDAAVPSCGPAEGPPGERGLPASYVIPGDATEREATVIGFALAQLDKPYVFGAAGPAAFDCSGLVMAAWATVGVDLPHSTLEQAQVGVATTTADLQPGDLVLVAGDDGSLAAPDHVGLYLGDDLVINAADEQDGIRVQTLDDFIRVGHGLAGLRHLS